MQKLELDYINGYAVNQYAFLPMPYMLIDHPAYKELGAGEKILYTLMLNRLSLSGRNSDKFTDRKGRLYIIYTVQHVCQDMNCSKPTAVKYLENLTKIGLIERVRQGQGKPAITYIKDFASVQKTTYRQDANIVQQTDAAPPVNAGEQRSTSFTPRSKDVLLQEVKKPDPSYLDDSCLDNSNPSIKVITDLGKRKNITLTAEALEGLKEDYGTRLEELLNECSDRIFARSKENEPIKNYYRYIQTIAKTMGYKTKADIQAEKEKIIQAEMEKKLEEQARIQALMEEYGAATEDELDQMMREENRRKIAELQEKIAGIF